MSSSASARHADVPPERPAGGEPSGNSRSAERLLPGGRRHVVNRKGCARWRGVAFLLLPKKRSCKTSSMAKVAPASYPLRQVDDSAETARENNVKQPSS